MSDFDFILRLIVAIMCGIAVGFERRWTNRIAGIQTTILVVVGSCLFVMTANYIQPAGEAAGRIIGQIISGIGFLGAGMIFKDGFRAHGINSAANIWAVAAVGALIGLGQIMLSVFATFALIFTNVFFKHIDQKITKIRMKYDLRIVNKYEINVIMPISDYSEEMRSKLVDTIGKDDDTTIFSVKTNFDKKDHFKLSFSISTHNLDYTWVTQLTKEISALKPKIIVDWSQI